MSLTRDIITTFELDESGEMRLKTLNRVIDTNDTGATDPKTGDVLPDQVISAVPHREVLNPASTDYQDKLQVISERVVGQLAVQQQVTINQRDAELAYQKSELASEKSSHNSKKSECVQHEATIATLTAKVAELEAAAEQ